ncbi:hypothetical protein BH708_02840 [Brachybacterium sp. P6-10-X1]|nr:hypothetical protein BH708_02840 [Brachybacterium sp. P6-10-X1]
MNPVGEQPFIKRFRRGSVPVPGLPVASVRLDESDGGQRVQVHSQALVCEAERFGEVAGECWRLSETEIDLCPLPVRFREAGSREIVQSDGGT